jgi:hypothetical protein
LGQQGTAHANVVNPDTGKPAGVCLSLDNPDDDYTNIEGPTVTGAVGVGGLRTGHYAMRAYSCGDTFDIGFEQVLAQFDAVAGQDVRLGRVPIRPRDADGDGLSDKVDNCPLTPNPNQADVNHDDLGNVCDLLRPGSG